MSLGRVWNLHFPRSNALLTFYDVGVVWLMWLILDFGAADTTLILLTVDIYIYMADEKVDIQILIETMLWAVK